MSLADHWDSGSFLNEGRHHVRVSKIEAVEYNSGNNGIAIHVEDRSGRTSKASFVFVDKAIWRLASFVAACGFTKEQVKTWSEFNPGTYQRLVGRWLEVSVAKEEAKNGKFYANIVDWEKLPHIPGGAKPTVDSQEADESPQGRIEPVVDADTTDEVPF